MSINKNQYDTILENWIHEFENNPHYSQELQHNTLPIKTHSKKFLTQILALLKNKNIQGLNKTIFEPVFDTWHSIIQNQLEQGLSTKETALMIYALKTSLSKLSDKSKIIALNEKNTLSSILDILGMLIFEMYTLEKEKLISRQNNQIQYLQHHTAIKKSKLIGSSPQICAVYQAIGLVLENDITVLLQGDSGTGKDVIAQTIHDNSKRSTKPYIPINCGGIPRDLVESELFGHEKGSFTSADSQKIGKFELADGGTLFLDEISELPTDLQVKLLRAIQNKEIERVGGTAPIKINVRIIAATNQNLKHLVDTKKFRLDLYYRLNVFPISIPPLKERKEDIIQLATHFLSFYSKQYQMAPNSLTDEAQQYLLNYPFEGNVRELENMMQRALIIAQGHPITSTILELQPGKLHLTNIPALPEGKPSTHELIPLEEMEKNAIINALTIKKGNIQQIAKALGISRTTLYNKIEKYNIDTH
jgi:transcriptional regulator with PAS, ATPase and Fis domain